MSLACKATSGRVVHITKCKPLSADEVIHLISNHSISDMLRDNICDYVESNFYHSKNDSKQNYLPKAHFISNGVWIEAIFGSSQPAP